MTDNNKPFVDGQWREIDLAEIEQQLYAQGHDLAKRSGSRETEEIAESSLGDLAHKAAARLSAAAYEPGTNIADEYAENRYRALLLDQVELKRQAEWARVAWRDRSYELAALGDSPDKPAFPLLVAIAAVFAIGLTVTPTFHDLLFVSLLGKGAPALIGALFSGSLVASVLVWGILSTSNTPGSNARERWAWTAVGLFFGLALYLMRASLAASNSERLLSIGLAILEAVFVVLVERVAAHRSQRLRAIQEVLQTQAAAERQFKATRTYLEDRLNALATCEAQIAAHHEHVREREHLVRAVPKLQAAAQAAAKAGYQAGLASNRGIVHDGAFAPPTAKDVHARRLGIAKEDKQ